MSLGSEVRGTTGLADLLCTARGKFFLIPIKLGKRLDKGALFQTLMVHGGTTARQLPTSCPRQHETLCLYQYRDNDIELAHIVDGIHRGSTIFLSLSSGFTHIASCQATPDQHVVALYARSCTLICAYTPNPRYPTHCFLISPQLTRIPNLRLSQFHNTLTFDITLPTPVNYLPTTHPHSPTKWPTKPPPPTSPPSSLPTAT